MTGRRGVTLIELMVVVVLIALILVQATGAQWIDPVAALLVALRMKGEAVPELVGFARAMRQAARSYALTASWDAVFEGVYSGYQGILPAALELARAAS